MAPSEPSSLTRSLRRGALHGLGLGTAIFVWCLATNGGFAVMGVQSDTLTSVVTEQFLGEVVQAALTTWAALALLAAVACALTRAAVEDLPRPTWLTFFLVGVAHLSWAAGAVVYAPQLFTEQLYDQGAWRAALQVWLTESLTPWQARVPALAVLAFVAGRLAWRLARAIGPRLRPGGLRAIERRLRPGGLRAIGRHLRPGGLRAIGLRATLRPWPRGRWVLGGAVLAGAVVWAAARPATQEPGSSDRTPPPAWRPTGDRAGRPNILLIGVDSLREDRLDDPRVVPNLARLAARGTRLTRAYTAIPRTFPSWVTILTGRYPGRTNIRHMFPRAEQRATDFEALPQRLGALGYRSALVSDFAGDIFTRIELGFDTVIAPEFHFPTLIAQRSLEIQTHLLPYVIGPWGRAVFPVVDELSQLADADLLTDRAITAVDAMRAEGAPWLLTLFYGNAHFPYAAQHPYYRAFTDPAYTGRSKYHRPPDVEGVTGPITPADERQIRGLFDGALQEVDAAVARLLAHLEATGGLENTYIVLLADHGENLGEPGMGIGHGEHLRGEAALRIPLVFVGPEVTPAAQVDVPVRSADLVPTLLGLVDRHCRRCDAASGLAAYGQDRPAPDLTAQGCGDRPAAGAFDGLDLASALRGEAPFPAAPVVVETGIWFSDRGPDFFQHLRLPYPDVTALCEADLGHDADVVLKREWAERINVAKHRAWIEGRWKLIYLPLPDGVRFELHDVEAPDAGDVAGDVAAQHPDIVSRLREALYGHAEETEGAVVRAGYILPGPLAAPAGGPPLVPQLGDRTTPPACRPTGDRTGNHQTRTP